MRIKNLFLALLALPLFFVACDKGNDTVDTPKDATVTITAGSFTESEISFTIASTNAEKVAYIVIEAAEEAPMASEVLANGVVIDANKSVDCTKGELKAETTYTIIAVAQNSKGVDKKSIEMTTLQGTVTPDPTPDPDPTPETFVATNYYAEFDNSEGINIYCVMLGDKEIGDEYMGVDGGTYYTFYFISSTIGGGKLPNGIYTLDSTYGANTIIADYSYRHQMENGELVNGMEIFSDANLTISDGKIEAQVVLDRDGSIHNIVFEGELAVEDGGGNDEPLEFEATHTADKWLWAGAGRYGNEYMVSGENFSVDVHFQEAHATENAIVAGEYIWTNSSWWGYNDFADFTTLVLEVDGKTIPVDGGILVVSNEGEEYHIELTLHGRDNDVTYMIEYNGKINDKGEEGGENTMVINTLSEGTYNSSYYFYTYKAAGDNFTLDLLVNEYQGNATAISAGSYTFAPMKSLSGNQGYFFVENFKIDGVKNTPQINSTMEVVGDGSNVEITINITTTVGDVYTVTYNGTIGEQNNEGGNEGGSTELVKLATPSVAGLVDGNAVTVSWNEIVGAKDYTVTLNGTDVQTVSTTYIVYNNLEYATTYSVSVVANPADAAVNAASDAGTTSFTIEAQPEDGGDEGDEGDDGDYIALTSLSYVGDLMGANLLNQFVAKSADENFVIYFSVSNNPARSTTNWIQSGDYTIASVNSTFQSPSSFYFNMSVTDGKDTIINGELFANGLGDSSNCTMTVNSDGAGANHEVIFTLNAKQDTYQLRFNGTIN